MRSIKAVTLVEAIIAIFMLAGGFVVVTRCYHAALRHSTRVTTRLDAVLCAQNRIRAMRAWSQVHHHPAGTLTMDQWGPYAAGGPTVDPADSRFSITTVITNPAFYDPCTTFEFVEPAASRRFTLPTQRRQVTIRVTWGGSEIVDLTSILCAPPPRFSRHTNPLPMLVAIQALCWLEPGSHHLALDLPPGPVAPPPTLPAPNVISTCRLQLYQGASDSLPTSITLSHNQTETYNAVLECQSGGVTMAVPARVSWFVLGPGNGTLVPVRGGNRVTFHNFIQVRIAAPPGTKKYYTDQLDCTLRATAKYAGRIVTAETPPLSLVP